MNEPTGVNRLKSILLTSLFLALHLLLGPGTVQAQDGGVVEVLTGRIALGEGDFYLLPNLAEGQTLFVYAHGTSGNLDPFVALAGADLDTAALADDFETAVDRALAEERDPLAVVPDFADAYFLAWDDDSGAGYDAALTFTIPADGDYKLMVTNTPASETLGSYRVTIGLDAPQVLGGMAEPTGDAIAVLDTASSFGVAVQEVTGTLTVDKTETFFTLNDIFAGDTLYVFVEATSGDLTPIILLSDFGDKPLASANVSGAQASASLQFTFNDAVSDTTIVISSCCEDGPTTTGDFRLLVGINAPGVLTGEATSKGQPVFQSREVQVGIKIEQIIGVNQTEERIDLGATIQIEWQDPLLAFSPDSCGCSFKTLTMAEITSFIATEGLNRWPEFTLFNLQGRQDVQNRLLIIEPNGAAIYVERFSAAFQIDFDFRRFPFDSQQFFVHIDSVFPEEFYVYTDLTGFSGFGDELGEEEWIVTGFDTRVSTQDSNSRFTFVFDAQRHTSFYVFRIFIPILLIIIVSWITFFLKDYRQRVEVTSANLLVFVAFNFTVSADLPRLGYLTFMDAILIGTFVISVLVVIYNVYLRRLEVNGRKESADRIDRYMDWLYPLAYIVALAIVTLLFFGR